MPHSTKHILTLLQCFRVGQLKVSEDPNLKRLLLIIIHCNSGKLIMITLYSPYWNESVSIHLKLIRACLLHIHIITDKSWE